MLLASSAVTAPGPPTFSTRQATQPLDHFSYASAGTIPVRYLVNELSCKNKSSCPIVFYCGGEDEITAFANATGFLWEVARNLEAVLVYAEHRFYGASLPSNQSSYDGLSSQQAMADMAAIAADLKLAHSGPVVAVGGSYGGMLAAWLRAKYPSTFSAALASSAPVLYAFDSEVGAPGFFDVVSADFTCASAIRSAFEELLAWVEQSRFAEIQTALRLCQAPTSTVQATNTIALVQQVAPSLIARAPSRTCASFRAGGFSNRSPTGARGPRAAGLSIRDTLPFRPSAQPDRRRLPGLWAGRWRRRRARRGRGGPLEAWGRMRRHGPVRVVAVCAGLYPRRVDLPALHGDRHARRGLRRESDVPAVQHVRHAVPSPVHWRRARAHVAPSHQR